MCAHTQTCMYAYTHTHMHTHMCAYTHTHTNTCTHTESLKAEYFTCSSEVAWFTIDLNQPPDQRWNELAIAKVTQVISSIYKLSWKHKLY